MAEYPEEQKPEKYTYHWDYGSQTEHDRKRRKKEARRGALRYAVIMTIAFLLCLGVLIGTLLLNPSEEIKTSLSTEKIAEAATPGIVLISATGTSQFSYGTGFFVRSDGYLVTNCHVVAGAESVQVTLYNGTVLDAEIKWYSAPDDLAILKIEGKHYPALTIGDSSAVKVGERAIAIGNPAGNLCQWSTTEGVISAVHRNVTVEERNMIIDLSMIQTDAPVNPGNSGGPLFNDRGEVIGIVTRKMTEYEGLGLAIPINGAMEFVNAYLNSGSTGNINSSYAKTRPVIGIQAATIRSGEPITDIFSAPQDGILVVSVSPGSAADGLLETGDVILEVNGKRVTDMDSFREILYRCRTGDTLQLKINRFGKALTVKVKL